MSTGSAAVRSRVLVRVALGGALGTAVRLVAAAPLVLALRGLGPGRLLVLNVAGAAVLGTLLARRERSPFVRQHWPFLATGLLGGTTTFSSMVLAAGRLGHDLGLVDPGSARMRPVGLALTGAYLTVSIALGLAAFVTARRATGAPRTLDGSTSSAAAPGDRRTPGEGRAHG